jgi:anti-anti-sigma regulatory factor
VLDAYEPAANRIANTVAVGFVQERERIIRQQQEAIRELSTPCCRSRPAAHPAIIGVIDPSARASSPSSCCAASGQPRQGRRGRHHRRAAVDAAVANHLVQTVDASRLMGANVIVTGPLSEIAQTLVTIGVDLGKINAVGDLQGGIEEAERLLGYKVIMTAGAAVGAAARLSDARPILKQRRLPDRVDPVGAQRRGPAPAARRPREAGGQVPFAGAIVDVTVLDVMDSFAVRTLRTIAHMIRCAARDRDRGHPARGGLRHGPARSDPRRRGHALDLEEGLAYLDQHANSTRQHA